MALKNSKKDRFSQLQELQAILAEAIDAKPGARDLAQLAKQYRETLEEIEHIGGAQPHDDEISEILTQRESLGKPGAVRKCHS